MSSALRIKVTASSSVTFQLQKFALRQNIRKAQICAVEPLPRHDSFAKTSVGIPPAQLEIYRSKISSEGDRHFYLDANVRLVAISDIARSLFWVYYYSVIPYALAA